MDQYNSIYCFSNIRNTAFSVGVIVAFPIKIPRTSFTSTDDVIEQFQTIFGFFYYIYAA